MQRSPHLLNMKKTKIDLDVYPVSVIFFVGAEKNDIIKELDNLDIYYTTDDYDCIVEGLEIKGFCYKLDERHQEKGDRKRAVFILWQAQRSTTDEWRITLAHETLHLTHYILEDSGQEAVPFDDDEILVYLFDYLYRRGLEST